MGLAPLYAASWSVVVAAPLLHGWTFVYSFVVGVMLGWRGA